MNPFAFIGQLFGVGADVYKARQDRKAKIAAAKDELVLAKINAETNRFNKLHDATTNWDIEAMRQSQFSWKDEILMVILFLPFVAAFIPNVQGYVKTGFDIVAELPLWYQLSLVGVIAASFGLRWLFQGKMDKIIGKGSL